MNKELVLHGVPKGHCVWDNGVNDKYFETFYTNKNEKYKGVPSLLLYEMKDNKSYYTYIFQKNLIEYSGRKAEGDVDNVYFAMTFIVSDYYCSDTATLYELFKRIFETKVLNVVLKKTGEFYRYNIEDFKAIATQLNELKRIFFDQIDKGFASDFKKIEKVSSNKIGVKCYNILDIDSKAFFSDLHTCNMVLISDAYKSKELKINELQSENDRIKEREKELNIKVSELEKKVDESNSIIKNRESEFESQKVSLASKDSEVKQLKIKNEEKANRLSEMERWINNMPKIHNKRVGQPLHFSYDDQAPTHTREKDIRKNNKPLALEVLSLFGIVVILLLSLYNVKQGYNEKDKTQIEELRNENLRIRKDYAVKLQNTVSNHGVKIEYFGEHQDQLPEIIFTADDYNKGDDLQKDKIYTVEIFNYKKNGGSWAVDGLELVENTVTSDMIIKVKVKENNNDKVYISYRDRNQKRILRYTLHIK